MTDFITTERYMETTQDNATHEVHLINNTNKRIGTPIRYVKAKSIDEIMNYMKGIKQEVIGVKNLINFEQR